MSRHSGAMTVLNALAALIAVTVGTGGPAGARVSPAKTRRVGASARSAT
jgi:hypothetical protein